MILTVLDNRMEVQMSEVRDFIVGLNERKIAGIRLVEDHTLQIELDNGDLIEACDEGQDCCEWRYMTTDDDLAYFVGSELVDIEIRNGGHADDEWGEVHEIEFLLVTTSLGVFTIENHNEHNGYYGGFNVVIKFRALQIANVYTHTSFSAGWGNYELKPFKDPWA